MNSKKLAKNANLATRNQAPISLVETLVHNLKQNLNGPPKAYRVQKIAISTISMK